MADRPLDFSSLDPTRDDALFHELSRTLADEAISARRRPHLDVISELARLTRPALAAAVVIAAGALFDAARRVRFSIANDGSVEHAITVEEYSPQRTDSHLVSARLISG